MNSKYRDSDFHAIKDETGKNPRPQTPRTSVQRSWQTAFEDAMATEYLDPNKLLKRLQYIQAILDSFSEALIIHTWSVYEQNRVAFVLRDDVKLDYLPEFYWGEYFSRDKAQAVMNEINVENSRTWHYKGAGRWESENRRRNSYESYREFSDGHIL